MKSDIEVLQESLDKYKDKNGKKAQSLDVRIESFKAWEKLARKVLNEGIRESCKICDCELPYFPTGNIKYCSRCNKPTIHSQIWERT
jgi:hypothetical protein